MKKSQNSKSDPEKLVSALVGQIIGSSKNFKLTKTQEGEFLRIEIKLEKEDIGKIVGRGGSTIWAIRRLTSIAGTNSNQKVFVSIAE